VIDSSFQTGARIQGVEAEGIVYGRWQFGEPIRWRSRRARPSGYRPGS
jgi:hypothetical protein